MKDEELIAFIDNFITSRTYHYAIMINGSWGCGKSYFITKVLIPYLKEVMGEYDVNYISLYGLKDPEDIGEALCVEAVRKKFGKVTETDTESQGAEITSVIMGKLLKFIVSHVGLEKKDAIDVTSSIANYNNNIIIFDDLERCCCDVNQILGYINNFVEHSDASVIIVANEAEIGNVQLDLNPELQMLVALNNRLSVDIPLLPEEALLAGFEDDDTKLDTYTVERLQRARKVIFQGNEIYQRTKEKLVSHTIEYVPDLTSIFKKISMTVENHMLKDNLVGLTEWFVKISELEDQKNIRTFQSFVENMITLVKAVDEKWAQCAEILCKYCFRSVIRHAKGLKLPAWERDFGNVSFGYGISEDENLIGFQFIDDLILSQKLDKAHVDGVIHRFLKEAEEKGQFAGDPIQLINNWYEATDEEVLCWLSQISSNIAEEKYTVTIFPKLIRILSNLDYFHLFPEQTDEVFASIISFIETVDENKLCHLEKEDYIYDGALRDIYSLHMSKMIEKIENRIVQGKGKGWPTILGQPNWGEALLPGIKDLGWTEYSFIYWVDAEDLAERIRISDNLQLNYFRTALTIAMKRPCEENIEKEEHKKLDGLYKLLMKEKKFNEEGSSIKNVMISLICDDIKHFLPGVKSADT